MKPREVVVMSMAETATGRYPALRDLSPAAQAAAQWFRQLARTLRLSRLYGPDNDVVRAACEQSYEQLIRSLDLYEKWTLRITASEIFLADEPVVRPSQSKPGEHALPGKEEALPFQLYRDGIRALTFLVGLPRSEFEVFFDAMGVTGIGRMTQDDLVTLLWQANLNYLRIDAVPLEQTIYLSSRTPSGSRGEDAAPGLAYSLSPTGEEIHSEMGQIEGLAQGLHRDTFDDWEMPVVAVEVPVAYEALLPAAEPARAELLAAWQSEQAMPWGQQVTQVLRGLMAVDASEESLTVFSRSAATWLAGAIQSCAWDNAQEAFALLRELDPDGQRTDEALGSAIAGLDSAQIADRLDESGTDDRAKFFALMVAIGKPSLALTCAVMAGAEKSRTRAAAVTTLCYFCSDEPELLAPYLRDSRWYVVRNTVFVLGQIGGPAVVDLIAMAAHHPEPRVRRQVVQSLGSVLHEARRPILLQQLDTRDPQLLSVTLNMLARQKDPLVSRAILAQIEAPDFESRSEENQRALFAALGDVAGNEVVPALTNLLNRGGWFARRTVQRSHAARTLMRIGTDRATEVVHAGLRSPNEAVRHACLDASTTRVV